jgi:hypothetical protein
VETAAASHSAERLWLCFHLHAENYLFLSDNLKAINASSDLPLAQYAAEAHERYTTSLQLYVASVWEYAFKQLVVRWPTRKVVLVHFGLTRRRTSP